MKISELFIYPVKSARAQSVSSLNITQAGPEGDREWMLVDDQGRFLSQRTLPKLATLEVFQDAQSLTLGMDKMFFKITKKNNFNRPLPVQVWKDDFQAALEADLYSQGISQYLGVSCRLVRYAPFSERKVGVENSSWQQEVKFADSRPLSILNLKSLEDLNSRLAVPVEIQRFRGNIIYSGKAAFEEDAWKKIRIGSVIFSQPKRCTRCVMINIDQKTGESSAPEPLKTLSSYRRNEKGVVFGSLWIPENPGLISLQDSIEVL